MDQHRQKLKFAWSHSSASRRVFLAYIVAGVMWMSLAIPLGLYTKWAPLLIVSLRILYFFASAIILFLMLRREGTFAERRFEYNQLLDALLEPVVLHVQGMIVWVNPIGVQFFEAQAVDELVGKHILDIVHPDYRGTVKERIQQLKKGQATLPIEEKFFTLKGNVRDVEVTGVPITFDGKSAVLIIFRDITEQKQQQVAIQSSEQRYRSLFENDGDMVVSVDVDGRILAANPHCQATLGYCSEELVGLSYEELIAPDYLDAVRARFPLLLVGQPQNHLIEIVHRNGQQVEVHEKEVPIIIDNQVKGFFWIVRDITEQRAAEELLIQSERLSAVGQMAAGIAHEIKNPLTALKGFVQLMQRPEPASHRPSNFYLSVMKDELTRIETIINELLIYAKPSEPLLQPSNCVTLIQEVIDLLSAEATLRNIEMALSLFVDSVNVPCDRNRLKQVLVNIIKNAMEAMPDGGQINIDVYTVIDERFISISVQDNGPGIPQDELARLGEPFYTTKGTGTGLGLMVSRKIIENHQGSLHIQSEIGKGTTVTIRLPL